MLSAIDRNHCPQSTGTPVRNRRNPQSNSLIVTARLVSDRIRTEIALEPCYPTPLSNSRTFGHGFGATEGAPWLSRVDSSRRSRRCDRLFSSLGRNHLLRLIEYTTEASSTGFPVAGRTTYRRGSEHGGDEFEEF